MAKFEVGKRYFECASFCPSTSTFFITRRTEKSVWDQNGKRHSVRFDQNGDEYFNIGSYAWHPVCYAACEWSEEELEHRIARQNEYVMMT